MGRVRLPVGWGEVLTGGFRSRDALDTPRAGKAIQIATPATPAKVQIRQFGALLNKSPKCV